MRQLVIALGGVALLVACAGDNGATEGDLGEPPPTLYEIARDAVDVAAVAALDGLGLSGRCRDMLTSSLPVDEQALIVACEAEGAAAVTAAEITVAHTKAQIAILEAALSAVVAWPDGSPPAIDSWSFISSLIRPESVER